MDVWYGRFAYNSDVTVTCLSGTWDGFVALQAVTRMKIAREKCVYSGEIRQGQR